LLWIHGSSCQLALSAFYEVDRCSIVIAALASLPTERIIPRDILVNAIERYSVNRSTPPLRTI
jgi:pyruvate dehydrogenase complex dehydrogenase (E1) component